MRSLTLAALSLISLPFALVLAPVTTPAQEGPALMSPEAIGQIFCLSRTGNDMAPVQGLLTDDLSFTIAKAEQESDAWAAANPGEKPPLGDGVPWADFPDYAPICTVGPVALASGKALVTISYGFPETPAADYSDELALVEVADETIGASRWRIDNVIFADDYDLRQALSLAFVDYQ
jgi:hypothetical protein